MQLRNVTKKLHTFYIIGLVSNISSDHHEKSKNLDKIDLQYIQYIIHYTIIQYICIYLPYEIGMKPAIYTNNLT